MKFDEALTMSIPDRGITLALYEVVAEDPQGKTHALGYSVRYSRAGNIHATHTDAMLVRFRPVK